MNEEHSNNGSVPLIPLSRRRDYSRLSDDNDNYNYHDNDHFNYNHQNNSTSSSNNPHAGLDDFDTSYRGSSHPHQQLGTSSSMARGPLLSNLRMPAGGSKKGSSLAVISSYAFDWIIIIAIFGIAYWWNGVPPNRRPFSLEDPNISFPFTEHETVPPWLLITLCTGVPIVVIPIISLLFVPGRSVPRGTPAALVWRRKLWELHVGWLGLALAIAGTWFVTNGMKNLFGKPRPDALARCNPDLDNFARYVVGGADVADGFQRLVSADICRGMAGRDDAQDILEDGFRSYPSGHASSSAAGLIYLSLFIASKFAITFPFLPPGSHSLPGTSFTAFPSRARANQQQQQQHQDPNAPGGGGAQLLSAYNTRLSSARRQAAAPPLYLLAFAAAPSCVAVFIASSRWFDFRHHGFDILFGFLIGTVCAVCAFRWYHLPVSRGAGWAWGPRCADKAWWAGVGSFSYAMDWEPDVGAAAVDAAAAAGGVGSGADLDVGGRMMAGGVGGGRGDEGSAMEEGRSHKGSLSMGSTAPGYGGDMESRRRVS